MAKLIPQIFGGLGNQLFIYSAARRLALTYDAELVLDNVTGFQFDHQYQRRYQLDHFNIPCRKATAWERLEPFSRLRRYTKRRWNQRLVFERRHFISQDGNEFDPRLLAFKPQGTVYLEGYWQSEGYFKDIETQIREDLCIQPPTDTTNIILAERISATIAVAVHVRYFDSPGIGSPGKLIHNSPGDYYRDAVHFLERRIKNTHYYIFSDQPHLARHHIPLPDDRVTLVCHNLGDEMGYADLWLMTKCSHFIIANSTFSWWGAWLAANPDKVIIAPRMELRSGKTSWGFKGLLPDQWITL